MNAQIERAGLAWNGLSVNRRVAVIGVVLTAVMAGVLLLLTRPPQQYDVAFSGLSSDDASAIVSEIRTQGIPYQLSPDGSTIRVPTDKVADVRLDVASKGLPKSGGVGFELFDQSSFGITDFAQQVNYQRALEGELERTINHLDAVAGSRVHIVIPQQSLFTDQQQPTTAAVVLQLKTGRQLTADQVRGITNLVSGAVPNLKPENLSVIDNSGNPIWTGGQGGAQSASLDDHFRQQQAYEANAEQQLQTLVNQVVGPNHAVVRVNATLNWDQHSTDNEIYSPDGTQGQIRSQQEQTQTSTSSSTTATGVPGVSSNVQTYQQATPGTTGAQGGTVHDVTTNYELSKRVEHIVQAPGQLERLSVAVVLDGKQVDPAVSQQIQSLVSAAAGIVPQRGDTITVSAVPFSTAGTQNLAVTPATPPIWVRSLSVLKIVGLIAVPLVALFFARRVLTAPRPLLPAVVGGVAPSQETRRISVNEVIGQPAPVAQPPRSVAFQQQVVTLANSDPAQLAQLIRTWMSEDD